MQPLRTILTRLAVLSMTAAVVLLVAHHGNTTGTTFASKDMGLTIDSTAFYNGNPVSGSTWSLKNLVPGADKFFDFGDIKPGDSGKTIVSIHPKRSSAWLCLDFSNFKNLDPTQTEPEAAVDPNGTTTGELASGLQFFGWLDNGDDVYEPGEQILFGTSTKDALSTIDDKSYAIADDAHGKACRDGGVRYVGVAWCAGNLSVSPSGAFSCDGSVLGNAAQTDTVKVDVSIRARPSGEDPYFMCNPSEHHGGHIGKGGKGGGDGGSGSGGDWHEEPPPFFTWNWAPHFPFFRFNWNTV